MNKNKKVNKDFFKHFTFEMAYVLGFLFADGNISINKRGGSYFSFYSADKDLLEFIGKVMSSDHKISKRNSRSGNVYRIQIGSKEIVEDLSKLGVFETKTKRMQFPKIPPKYIPTFILGFFDGDGNVWAGEINKKRLKPTKVIQTAFTSASKDFLINLHCELKRLGIQGGFIYDIKNKFCHRLILSIQDSLKFYKIVYNGACTPFCLKRKEKVFKNYIKMRL